MVPSLAVGAAGTAGQDSSGREGSRGVPDQPVLHSSAGGGVGDRGFGGGRGQQTQAGSGVAEPQGGEVVRWVTLARAEDPDAVIVAVSDSSPPRRAHDGETAPPQRSDPKGEAAIVGVNVWIHVRRPSDIQRGI
jgi:hypothetical protein